MFSDDILDRVRHILDGARARGLMIATAESCTGGLIAATLTEIAGSSDVFDRGFVTYSNAAKMTVLGVRPQTLAAYGAVSAETAAEMAEGALRHSDAAIALSVTGIAGPGGGSADKPVGLVWFGLARRGGQAVTERQKFAGTGRDGIRLAAVHHGLEMLSKAMAISS